MKTFLDHGKLVKSDTLKPDYTFQNPSDFFSTASNLISSISAVSGGRVLLGDKANLQALSLTHRQTPLAQSAPTAESASFVEQYGKDLVTLRAKNDGVVKEVSDTHIVVGDNKHELAKDFSLGRKSFLTHTPSVQVGDKVKKGDLLATSNWTDHKGTLALGTNLRCALIPFKSFNYEDSYLLSASGAKKLEAEQVLSIRLSKFGGIETGKSKYISLFQNKYLNSQLQHIDETGVIKKGTTVKTGDPLILACKPKSLKSLDLQLGKLSKVLKNAYSDMSEVWEYTSDGIVTDVAETEDLITVNIKTKRALEVGDKVSISHGAKGVVAILPDSHVPHDKDGKPVDILLNTMSITSRVAPGLLTTMATAKVAAKLGHALKLPQFDPNSTVDTAIALCKKHGVDEMETLIEPSTGKDLKAFVGPLYVTRLTHIAEDKVSGRSQGVSYDWNQQPAKSMADESSKRLGNLGTAALLSNNATAVLRDIGVIRSTKNDEFWRHLKLGLPLPMPKVPFVFEKFIAHLQGAGITVNKTGNTFNILPQTDKEVEKISAGVVKEPLTYKVKEGELHAEEGGLFDPSTVGIYGNKFNHIDLHLKVPNPISEDPLRKMLGLTVKAFEEKVANGSLEKDLTNLNLSDQKKELEAYVKSGKKSDRASAVKTLSFIKMLQDNNMHPSELMLTKVPVIPAQYRPVMAQNGTVMSAPVNELYKDLMLVNNSLEGTEGIPDTHLVEARKKIYDGVKAVYGLGDAIGQKSLDKGYKGLLASALGFRGGQAKSALFQSNVVNKPIDLVGRAVLLPDAKLELDQASIPQETCWKIFKPFVFRRLATSGVPATKIQEYIEHRNPIAVKALMDEMAVRPGLISRDPQLHKFNMQGFFIKPNADVKDTTLKLSPLVFKGFTADCDGDGNFCRLFLVVDRLTFTADAGRLSHNKQELDIMTKTKLGITKDQDVYLTHIEDFPHVQHISTNKHIDFYSVPAGVKVVAIDEKTSELVLADVACWSQHKDVELEIVTLTSGKQIITDNDPRAIFGLHKETLEWVRSTPSDAKDIFVPVAVNNNTYDSLKPKEYLDFTPTEQEGSGRFVSKLKEHVPLNRNTGYVLGLLVGDGWADKTEGRPAHVVLAASYPEIQTAYAQALEEFTKEKPHLPITFSNEGKLGNSTGSYKVTFNSSHLAKFVLDNIGSGCVNKHLPSFAFSASKEFKLGLLAGLWDSDGSMSWGHGKKNPQFVAAFSSTSLRLAQDIQHLLITLDVRSTISKCSRITKGGKNEYALSVSSIDLHRLGGFPVVHAEKKKNQQTYLDAPLGKEMGGYLRFRKYPLPKAVIKLLTRIITVGKAPSLYTQLMRADGVSEAIVQDIFNFLNTNNVTIADPLFLKWKTIVTNKSVFFERVESVEKTGRVETIYDLTVPGYETFMSFDGIILSNTLNVQVPASEDARKEVIDKLMPSKNLISQRTFAPMFLPSNESALGLFMASYEDNHNKPIKFKSEQEAIDAYHAGKVDIADRIEIE